MLSTRFAVIFLCLGLAAPLRAQDFWTPDTGVTTTANLWSVAYGDRTLVVAGELGTLLTYSYDDQAWTPRASGGREWLVGAGYGNGRFVVVGDHGVILTSDDVGATWTPRVSGTTIRLNAAAYGGGRWLAVGEQGVVLTSVDGTTWESRPALGIGFLRALAYGQGRWLIGGARGALYTSTDAVTFTPVPISTTEDIEGAAISADRYWIVGSGAFRATATSLEAWTLPPLPTPAERTLRGVTVRNQSEASAIGDRFGFTYTITSATIGVPDWASPLQTPRFLGTAITQGLDELVSVGFGGGVARTPTNSRAYVISDSGPNAPYGTEVRYRILSGATPTAYQWTRDGHDIPGETGSELVLRNVKPTTHNAVYGARLTAAQGALPVNSLGRLTVVPAGRPEVRDTTFNSALPGVPSLAVPQPDGKLLVAGPFSIATTIGSTYGIARLNRDGTIDSSFRAGDGISQLSSINDIILLGDGRIYVTGSFSQISGQLRHGLARLLPNGALDIDFDATPNGFFPRKIAALPDGRLMVQTWGAAPDYRDRLVRLNRDGSLDTSFPDLTGNKLVGVDAFGRVLATRPANENPHGILTRYLAEGTRDLSYTETTLPNGFYDHFAKVRIVSETLYTVVSNQGSKMGWWETYVKYLPHGGVDTGYRPPGSPPALTPYSSVYLPDGSLVAINAIDSQARFYLPDGRLDLSRYASLPSLKDYVIHAGTDDSSLYVVPRANYATIPPEFIRIKAITGRVGRLTNLSVRAQASAEEPLIAGFVTSPGLPTSALIRAVGPSLSAYGVTDGLADPRLTLMRDGVAIAENDNWPSSLAPRFSAVGAFPLPGGSLDAALETSISAGSHTAIARPTTGGPGTTLVELYESTNLNAPVLPRRFVNVSARGPVKSGDPLIAGFAISGEVPVSLLIRGAGPALAPLGVGNTLSDPRLTLYRGNTSLWENDNADATANATASRVGAFAFVNGSRDSALLVTLPPGSYTAVLENVDSSSGNALIEVYEAP